MNASDIPIAAPTPATVAEIEHWLAGDLARKLATSPESIDRSAPLFSLGLDSMVLVSTIRELIHLLAIDVDLVALLSFPTVELMAEYLASLKAEPPVGTA